MTRWLVVGAGSGGAVVASRLAEHPDNEVVLLEAGPADPFEPSSHSFFDDLAEPGRVFDGLTAVRVEGQAPAPYRVGRGLGGSSAVNAMVALRGGPFRHEHLIPEEVAQPVEWGPVDKALLEAADDAEPVPLSRRAGRRVSVAEAYVAGIGHRGQLTVLGDAAVDRVVLDGTRAVGVVTIDGRQIHADRVVISAGAIHSPAILLRSGVDVPGIGVGLQDHPSAPITLKLRPEAQSDPSSLAVATLLRRGSRHVLPLNHLSGDARGYGLLMPALMKVRSRGRVTVTDPDPLVEPEVRFAMLSDSVDVAGLAEAVGIAVGLLDTGAFRSIVDTAYIDEHGSTVEALHDVDAIVRWLPGHVGDYVHASCTCRMGVVVDDHCRVIGHQGLYVCDASVFNEIPEVNTHLPTVMLAETMAARWLGQMQPDGI